MPYSSMDQLSEAINFCCSFSSSEVELSTNKLFLSSFFYIKDHNGLPVKNNNKLNAIFLLYLRLSPSCSFAPLQPHPLQNLFLSPNPTPPPLESFPLPQPHSTPLKLLTAFHLKQDSLLNLGK